MRNPNQYGDIFRVEGGPRTAARVILTRPSAEHAALENLNEWDGTNLPDTDFRFENPFSIDQINEMGEFEMAYVGGVDSCTLEEALTIIRGNPQLAVIPAINDFDPEIGWFVVWNNEVGDFVFFEAGDTGSAIWSAQSLHSYLRTQEWCVIKRPR